MTRFAVRVWMVAGALPLVAGCTPEPAAPPDADTAVEVDTTTESAAPLADTGFPAIDSCRGGTAAHVDGRGYSSVQEAVEAAGVGGTVLVCPGTWRTNLVLDGPVHIAGRGGPERTVLDGRGLGRVVNVPGGWEQEGEVRLTGLTITGGWAGDGGGDGGGVRNAAAGWTSLRLSHVVLADNDADRDGGGLWSSASTVLEDVRFVGNRAGRRGGGALAWVEEAGWEVDGAQFEGNTAVDGGGLAIWQPKYRGGGGVNARDVAFRDNVASDQGGGAWGDCEASDGAVLECLRCDFERNVAVDGGGLGDVARRRGSSPKLCVLNTALVTSRAGVAPERLRADPEVWGRLVESCVGAHLLNTGPADGLEVSRPAPRARRLPRSLSACARARGGCGFGRDPVGRLPGAAGGGVDRVNRGYRKPRT